MRKIIISSIVFSIIAQFVDLHAQDTLILDYEFCKIHQTQGLSYKVDFIDEETGMVNKTINLANENPYNHFDYPVKHIEANGFNIYDLSRSKIKANEDIFSQIKLHNNPIKLESIRCIAIRGGIKVSNDYLIIEYWFELLGFDESIGVIGMAEIYDHKGKRIVDLPENYGGYIGGCITKDSKYFAYNYIQQQSFGLRIIDVENSKTINDVSPCNKYLLSEPYCINNIIVEDVCRFNDKYELNIFKCSQNTVYKLRYSIEEKKAWSSIKDFGLLYLKNGSIDTIYFEKGFIKENL